MPATTITVTSPTAGTHWSVSSTPSLGFTVSPAVSVGKLRGFLINTVTDVWYPVGQSDAVAGRTVYVQSLSISNVPTGDYTAAVYYPLDSSGESIGYSPPGAVAFVPIIITVTSPTAGTTWPAGSTQSLGFTLSEAVSVGEFGGFLINTITGVWYAAGVSDSFAGRTVYVHGFSTTGIPAGTYTAAVYYRPDASASSGWQGDPEGSAVGAVTLGAAPLSFLWTNSYLAEIADDLATVRAAGIDVLFSYLMGQGPVWANRPVSASDAEMTAYLDALDAAGLRTMLDVMFLGKFVVSSRGEKALISGELADLTAYVNKWKTHPAVWGWYADDEGSTEYPVATRQQVYDTIKAAHPEGQVLECGYLLTAGAYSPDVHDVFAMDAGYTGGAYLYIWDDEGGCVNRSTGLCTNPVLEAAILADFRANLTALGAALIEAGETNYFSVMQAVGQGPDGTSHTRAMPPPGSFTKMWAEVKAAGWDQYGAGWFLWKSNDAATMPVEDLDGIGEAGREGRRAEMAAVASEFESSMLRTILILDGLNLNDGAVYHYMPGAELGARQKTYSERRSYTGAVAQYNVSEAYSVPMKFPLRVEGTSFSDLDAKVRAVNMKIDGCSSAFPKNLVFADKAYRIVTTPRLAYTLGDSAGDTFWTFVDLALNRLP